MKLTYTQILEVSDGLSHLADYQLRPSLSLKIARMLRKINEEAQDFYDVRRALVDQFAIKDKDGELQEVNGEIQFGDNLSIFKEKASEALNSEVDVKIQWLTLDDLECIEEVSPRVLYLLDSVIKE